MKLGVNIDHVATLRQARGGNEPDPLKAALLCEKAGCSSIVAHLREDRRHIQDRDIYLLKKSVKTKLNLEMSINKDIVAIALKIRPYQVTFVPEKRKELTTEGGLDVIKESKRIKEVINKMHRRGIKTSLFIDPVKSQIDEAKKTGAMFVELHTGEYANAKKQYAIKKELDKIRDAAKYCRKIGLRVNAGHGLNYANVKGIAKIKEIEELNIGHSIISRAVFSGIESAVREMLVLIR